MSALRRAAPIALCLAVFGCSATSTSSAAAGPTTGIKGNDGSAPASDEGGEEDGEQVPPGASAPCGVRQSPRTFVGFQNKQTLEDFDRTAAEAERVLAMSKVALCQLSAAQDKDGTLRAALSGGVVEITAIRFQGLDLAKAVLNLQTAPASGTTPSPLETRWLLHERRIDGVWRVVAAVRQKEKRR